MKKRKLSELGLSRLKDEQDLATKKILPSSNPKNLNADNRKQDATLNLPKGWEIKKLGEVLVKTEMVDPTKNPNIEFTYLDVSSVNKETKEIESATVLLGKDAPSRAKKLVRENDVIFATVRPTHSRVALITEEYDGQVCSTGYFVLRGKENIDNKYLFYYLLTYEFNKQMEKLQKGASYPAVTDAEVKSIYFRYPKSLPEQQRIVSILDKAFAAIDKAKANAEQNLKNAKELFDCVLDSILYDKKWNVEQLGNVCEKVEYGTSSKAKQQGELPVLRMGNIQNGRFVWDSLVYSDNKEDNKQYLLKYNDVLFNRTNSPELVGKTAIYKGEMPAIFAGYLIRIHRKENLLDADYLNYYLNSKMAFDYGKTVVISSVNQANINGTKLKTYPIPLPTLKTQQTIVRQLDALRAKTQKLEAVYQKKLDDLEELKKSILQKAFSGQLSGLGFDKLKDDRIIEKKKILQSSNPKNLNPDNL